MNQHSTVVASEEASKADPIGAGGDITISPGSGKPSGSIVFTLADGREMLRFDQDGDVYVRGEQVDDNQDIYLHFKRWLGFAHITPAEEGEPTDKPLDLHKTCVYAGETLVPEVFVAGCWHPLTDYSVSNLHKKTEDTGTGSGGDMATGPGCGLHGDGTLEAMDICEKAAARDGKTRVTHGFVRDYFQKVKP